MSDEKPTAEELAAKEAEKEAKKKAVAEAEAAAKEDNDTRTGVGTRAAVSQARGRSNAIISHEAWDLSLPETLPKTLAEFFTYRSVDKMGQDEGESFIVSRLLRGDNEILLEVASDPIAAFVDSSWSPEMQTRFKTSVRNIAKDANLSIEDAVSLIKPAIDAASKASRSAVAV